MRVYLPTHELETLLLGGTVRIPRGALVWAVNPARAANLKGEALEEAEADAQIDAVLSHVDSSPSAARVILCAMDLPESTLEPQDASMGDGAYRTLREETVPLAALFVSEKGARAIIEDEWAPELLWFDRTEVQDALNYARAATA